LVPHELAEQLHDLELEVVDLADDLRRPVLGNLRELLVQVHNTVGCRHHSARVLMLRALAHSASRA
jgi:hypothetical protein